MRGIGLANEYNFSKKARTPPWFIQQTRCYTILVIRVKDLGFDSQVTIDAVTGLQ